MAVRNFLIASAGISVMLTACASVSVYEVPNVQQNLSQALQRSEAQLQKAQSDYLEKQALLANLAKANTANYKTAAPELSRHLTAMGSSLSKVTEQRKVMQAASSDVASLGYHHTRIMSTDSDYDQFDETVKKFEGAAEAVNASLTAYSHESNTLTDLIAAKKLYKLFTTAEFQSRIQQNIKTAQANVQSMQGALDRTQDLVNNTTERGKKKTLQNNLSTMEALAKRYTERAQDFNRLSREMNLQTADAKQVTSLDNSWPRAQKLVSQFEKTVQDLANINGHFQQVYERLRPSAVNQAQ